MTDLSRFRMAILTIWLAVFTTSELYGQQGHMQYIDNHVYLDAEVNGKPAKLVFDTGAELIYLDSSFVRDSRLDFKTVANAMIDGIGASGPSKTKIVIGGVAVTLNGEVYKPQFTPLINLKPILGAQADGVFGMKALAGKVISINFKEGRFALYSKTTPELTAGYQAVPFKVINRKIVIPLAVTVSPQTRISGQAVMDVGSGSGIVVTSPVASKYALDKRADSTPTQLRGLGGQSHAYDIPVQGVEIGGIHVDCERVSYSTDKAGAMSSSDYVANVGNGVWSQFDMLLDLQGKMAYLRKR